MNERLSEQRLIRIVQEKKRKHRNCMNYGMKCIRGKGIVFRRPGSSGDMKERKTLNKTRSDNKGG